MSTTHTVDGKKRIILPDAQPGEVYDVEYIGGGNFRLRRLASGQRPMETRKCHACRRTLDLCDCAGIDG